MLYNKLGKKKAGLSLCLFIKKIYCMTKINVYFKTENFNL